MNLAGTEMIYAYSTSDRPNIPCTVLSLLECDTYHPPMFSSSLLYIISKFSFISHTALEVVAKHPARFFFIQLERSGPYTGAVVGKTSGPG